MDGRMLHTCDEGTAGAGMLGLSTGAWAGCSLMWMRWTNGDKGVDETCVHGLRSRDMWTQMCACERGSRCERQTRARARDMS